MELDDLKIGAFIRRLREEKGLTREKLSEEIGVSSKAIQLWENGENRPKDEHLEKLANFFGVTVFEILRGERDRKPASQTHSATEAAKQEIDVEIADEKLLISKKIEIEAESNSATQERAVSVRQETDMEKKELSVIQDDLQSPTNSDPETPDNNKESLEQNKDDEGHDGNLEFRKERGLVVRCLSCMVIVIAWGIINAETPISNGIKKDRLLSYPFIWFFFAALGIYLTRDFISENDKKAKKITLLGTIIFGVASFLWVFGVTYIRVLIRT